MMLYTAVVSAAFVALANAQSAPDWNLIPKACATQCAQTIQASFLCQSQFQGGTAIYGCFCEAYPSDSAACAACLTQNNAAALGTLLTGTQTDCAAQKKDCAFACAFDTCASSDVACQCSPNYLASIYNCASCNEATGHAGTKLADFNALKDSCGAQSFSGASQQFNTWVNSPTGQAGYQAPTLTATGGGDAATGTFTPAAQQSNPPASQGPVSQPAVSNPVIAAPSVSSPATGGSAAPAPKPAPSGASAAHTSGAATASSTTKPAGSASRMAVPAGVIAAIAGVAALV